MNLKGLPGRIAGHSSDEVPCPACYYSKEQASCKCYEHRHGESSLLSQVQFMLHTTNFRKKRAIELRNVGLSIAYSSCSDSENAL